MSPGARIAHLPHAAPGCVYIVGAGPGDPGLLTLKGARFLSEADVVFYDDLLDPRLLELAGPGCERCYAGHRGGRPADSRRCQAQLNQQLIDAARAGRRVVRLKGGDPYLFGRGGEEAAALRAAGVHFEVVPGVSAATAVPGCAGIPLTHRGVATTATLVSGHEAPGSGPVDWAAVAAAGGTIVVFMGRRHAPAIADALIAAGRPAATPAAAIQWGTRPQQRTVTATLESLPEAMAEAGLLSPVLLVIGQVVAQRPALEWFESRPLFGRCLLITRSRDQSLPLRLQLEAQGGEVFELPLLQLAPPEDPAPLDHALTQLARYAWILFTSPNAVRFFFERLRHQGLDSRALGGCRIGVVGATTAADLAGHGLVADLTPATSSAAGLAAALGDVDLCGAEVLIPASAISRTDLEEALTGRGALVTRVTAYENRAPRPAEVDIPAALTEGRIDCILFASPSAVSHFVGLLGPDRALPLLRAADIAVIGPTTARAVADLGLEPAVQPATHSVEDLVRAITTHYATDGGTG